MENREDNIQQLFAFCMKKAKSTLDIKEKAHIAKHTCSVRN